MEILIEKIENFAEWLHNYSPASEEERKVINKVIEKWEELNL